MSGAARAQLAGSNRWQDARDRVRWFHIVDPCLSMETSVPSGTGLHFVDIIDGPLSAMAGDTQ